MSRIKLSDSLDDFLEFNEPRFRHQILLYNQVELTALHACVKQKIISAGMSGTASLGAAFFTAGFTLVGAGIAARRLRVNERSLSTIEERLQKHGWAGYNLRKRDFGIPEIASMLGMGVGLDVDTVVGSMAGAAAGAATMHGSDAVKYAIENPAPFYHGIQYGASATVSNVSGALSMEGTHNVTNHAALHAASLIPRQNVAAAQAANIGAHVGYIATEGTARKVIKKGAQKGVQKGLEAVGQSLDDEKGLSFSTGLAQEEA